MPSRPKFAPLDFIVTLMLCLYSTIYKCMNYIILSVLMPLNTKRRSQLTGAFEKWVLAIQDTFLEEAAI